MLKKLIAMLLVLLMVVPLLASCGGDKPEEIDGSGAQGLEAQKVIHAAIRSLDTGKVVYLDEMFPPK